MSFMPVFDLYSKQQKALKKRPKRLRHDVFPEPLRTQVWSILYRVIGYASLASETPGSAIYPEVERILLHEYALSRLPNGNEQGIADLLNLHKPIERFFRIATVEQCLDVVQVMLVVAMEYFDRHRDLPRPLDRSRISVAEAIAEINARFKEHGLGFQFHDGHILKITSEYVDANTMLPTLRLLREPFLAGANQEFLKAHEHFRHGRYKECINECLKAFESTMKAICTKRGWAYQQSDTAKTLIKTCIDNGLFPLFMESHITGLRTTLESGVPTARNKTSAHGQGGAVTTVSEEFATYVMNITAANLLLLCESERKLK